MPARAGYLMPGGASNSKIKWMSPAGFGLPHCLLLDRHPGINKTAGTGNRLSLHFPMRSSDPIASWS